MKFQKLQLENFSSYYGKAPVIHLDTTPEKPIVIFVGGTGYGKTSVFDAINWALYGEDYESDLTSIKKRPILDYVNESALKEAHAHHENVTMQVTLYFEHDNKQYYISQTLTVTPKPVENGITAVKKDRLTLLKEILPTGDHVSIPYNKIFLDEILPNNVKSYFLFDGDRIHNLAKPGNSQEVREAIYRVVDLEIVRNAGEHLGAVAVEYSKKSARAAKGKLAEIENVYQEELKEEKRLKKNITDIKSEIKAIKSQLNLLDEKLKNRDETTKLQGKRNQLIADLERLEKEKKALKVDIRDAAATAALGLVNDQIKTFKSLLDQKKKKGEIPKHVQEMFFRDLYHLEECICGTKFKAKAGDPVFDHLQERSKIEQKRSKEDEKLLALSFELKEVTSRINTAKNLLDTREDQLLELEKQEKELVLEKQQVDNALEALPQEDIAALIQQRKEREGRKEVLISDLSTREGLLKKVQERLNELGRKRKEAGKQQKEAHALQYRSRLAKTAGETVDALYEAFAEESRREIEKLTLEEFRKFVMSSSGYRVGLNKDYELEVLDSNGNRALQRLSMGQSQCLSLAFITAISRVSEKHPPLVIDMPFSRLDPSVHESVSQRLPKISRQAILFLIPGVEWNNNTKTNLSAYANHIYEMEFDEQDRQTSITSIS